MNRRWLWPLLTLIGPVAALAAIWGPLLMQYHVPGAQVDAQRVEAALEPMPREVRERLMQASGGLPVAAADGLAVEKARRLMDTGRLQLGSFPEQSLELPFAPANLHRGGVSWKLQVAALVVPRLFMDAYRDSGEGRYLELARESILAWGRFEKAQWLPQGLLWNDHAVAARIEVLARFWQLYRTHPDLLSSAQAQEVLAFAARSLRLTAKPGYYTPRTNHGIFQDLALWLGQQAFPGLPAAEQGAQIAYQRFTEHLPYYLSPEGVVLEHSAGYQAVGLSLVGQAFRYMDLAGQPIKAQWWQHYREGIAFYDRLRRPDGTLPRIGDTHPGEGGTVTVARRTHEGDVERVRLETEAPQAGASLYPVAGYAIDWRAADNPAYGSRMGQTVLAWSHFPMAGHKHADELSLHFWAGGVDWWTGVGYWPYGHPGRDLAEGWTEGNAPHLVGERADSEREAELLGQVLSGEGPRLVDLRRRGGGYTVRRQFLSLPDGTRVVLDSATDERSRTTEVVWRTGPTVAVESLGEGAFRLRELDSGATLHAWFGGVGEVTQYYGEAADGIRGMVMDERRPVPTTSLVLRRPSEGEPNYVVWRHAVGEGRPRITHWNGPETWRLQVPGNGGPWEVRRDADALSLHAPSGAVEQVAIEPAGNVEAARGEIVAAYRAAEAAFAGERPLVAYRVKTTWLTGALFIAHGLGLIVLPFILGGLGRASVIVLTGWGVYVLWLRLYYFPL